MNGYTSLSTSCEIRFDVNSNHEFNYISLTVVSTHGFKEGDNIFVQQDNSYARLRVITTSGNTLSAVPLAVLRNNEFNEVQQNTIFSATSIVRTACLTRELITAFTRSGGAIPIEERRILRYPYLPEAWTGVSHAGLLLSRDRVDVKTFMQNITVAWESVLQDVVIEENFPQMDYSFFHNLWQAYQEGVHLVYCPRDLNQEEYEVELIEVKASKQHRFWVDGVTTRFKIHKILHRPYNVDLTTVNRATFPSGDWLTEL